MVRAFGSEEDHMSLIDVAAPLAEKVQLAIFQAEGVSAQGTSAPLETDLHALIDRLRATFNQPSDATALHGPARALYRSIGLDPTRRRPSSEALIRRIIRGLDLYRINRVVDTCNLCSVDFALPIGLYDTGAVQWPVALRLGTDGERYKGLGRDHVNVAGRWTLADAEGPFGNPSADSFRTRIRAETETCTFVIYAPASYEHERLEAHLRQAGESMVTYAGGKITRTEILPAD